MSGRFGRLHAFQHGPSHGPLVVGIHGLTGTHEQLARIGVGAGDAGLRFVALDLRGRGDSQRTSAGTYGWANHALDVVAVADALGADDFAVVGISMGGSIAMKTAELAGERLWAAVLVDVAGRTDAGVGSVIAEKIASTDPTKADPIAVAEDRAYTQTQHPYGRWRHLTMPTLLIRAFREIGPGLGHVVPADDRDLFVATVPTGMVVEVDATHLTIANEPATASAVARFLCRRGAPERHC
jgi:pimeloyl-ACP methyl ester carboxylesterase